MNKLLIVFICLTLLSFASAEVYKVSPTVKNHPAIKDESKCEARAVVHCGFGKNDASVKCRATYIKKCRIRYNLVLKCSAHISQKCINFKKGTLEYKRCERSVAVQNCVSSLDKKDLHECKCKSFARAVCGNCPAPAAVHCRDDAYEACKKQCGSKLECNEKKRICISEKNCNCKTQAQKKCAVSESSKTCFDTEFATCRKRCIASTRCYPVNCKNAGLKRCARAVGVVCKKLKGDLKQFEQCVTQKTKRCQEYEYATCKKARRLFKYRAECDFVAKAKCESLSGDKKCSCVSEVRSKCLIEKKEQRKKYIRHSSVCKKRAKLLCDAKPHCKDVRACYLEETKHCIRRTHRRQYIVPPECVDRVTQFCGSKEGECYKTNIDKCCDIWLKRYCENNAFKTCDGDLECMKLEIQKCKTRLPKCWGNRKLCNDNNKCTNDVCDPRVGCLHIPKTCDDKNVCTKDVCDKELGCVHTEVKCDDGVTCTKDYCNPANGRCSHDLENTACTTSDKCTVGYCTPSGCQFHKDGKCQPPKVEDICDKCKTTNPCKPVRCEIQSDLTAKCVETDLFCDDQKKCTRDYCNLVTGKCEHEKIDSPECTVRHTHLCDDVLDCSAWGVQEKLTDSCLVPVCDKELGVCVAKHSQSKKCVPVEICLKSCKPRDACDSVTTSCSYDEKENIICNRPETSCDDHSVCTVDTCNVNTGVCEHKFVQSKQCLEFCESDAFCAQWAIQSGLDDNCKTAKCNKQLKSCVIIPKEDQSKCSTITGCVDCVAKDKCQKVKCFYDEQGTPACKRINKKCDDNNPCTIDSCNGQTGKCSHVAIENKVCKKCKNEKDCAAWGASLNLAPICKTASCDQQTGFCKVSKLPGKCSHCGECTPSNKCETAECLYNKSGQPVCTRTSVVCNDFDDCTTDSCDKTTGKCVFTPIQSKKCQKCQVDADCKQFATTYNLAQDCKEAYCSKKGKCKARLTQDQSKCTKPICIDCLPLTPCDSVSCVVGDDKVPKCVHSQITCDDGDKCTTDYCDVTTGACVHSANECTGCKTTTDCAQWAKAQNLAASCQEAYCENNYCRVRFTNDQSKCQIPLCADCHKTRCDDSVECVFGPDNAPKCIHNPKSCDDGNKCTVDHCDITTGNCVSTFYQTQQCQPCSADVDCNNYALSNQLAGKCQIAVCNKQQGYCEAHPAADQSKCTVPKCRADQDCAAWATANKFADNCLQATCDTDAGKCISYPVTDTSKCPICVSCKSTNPCESATCVLSSNNGYICDRKPIDCNDHNDCTFDYCNKATGKCVHKTVYNSEKCISCSADKDCVAWGVSQKLNNCQEPFCNTDSKTCDSRAIKDVTCVPNDYCKTVCPPKDNCYESHCHYDASKNVVCDSQTIRDCNDNNDCTTDSCDTAKGCVHTYTPSNKCIKCSKDIDCSKYSLINDLDSNCQVAFCDSNGQCASKPSPLPCCVPSDLCKKTCDNGNKCQSYACTCDSTKKIQCTYVIKTCDDNKSCTKDSCDANTGLCIHEHSTDCGPQCKTTLNCIQWGVDNKLSAQCKQPFCDQTQGACVAVDAPDATKCPVPNCDKICPSTDKCLNTTCAYDSNKNVLCHNSKLNCDDNEECTVDSCDSKSGCVHTWKPSDSCTKCTKDDQCSAWAAKLGKCFAVTCDAQKKKCVKNALNLPECNHKVQCPRSCEADSLCSTATIVKEVGKCYCKISPKNCDDGLGCTLDFCDTETGKCVNRFQPSDKCTTPCSVDAQCAKYASDNDLSSKCQLAVCDKNLGSCVAIPDTKTNCITCQKDCKPHSNCEDAKCIWNGAKYTCQRSSKSCDDGKKYTKDYCDEKTGECQHIPQCTTACCNTDVDCVAWGQAKQLSSQCLLATCNGDTGSCQAIPDLSCKFICKQSSDCPPTKFGSVCDTSTSTCVPNLCQFDSDCLGTNNNPNVWNYCQPSTSNGQKTCIPKDKCTTDVACDDHNPCTKDVCLTDYGFCRNVQLCDDHNECTQDIATPSADGKSCTCANPPIPCTQDPTLLNKDFVLLSNDDKQKWLGKCDKNKGCITCVVNAQCDDHNGCSTDSCEQQYCVNQYVTYNGGQSNPWCDPKLASQPITFQSIPGLRDQLALAGYDITKLGSF
jgi:hypothetical protein